MTGRSVEEKLGFDVVRRLIAGRCNTDYATLRVRDEEFSTDPQEISRRLKLTDEMRLVLMFEEAFPTSGYIDGKPFLQPLEGEGSNIDLLSLGKLRTMTETVRKLTAFWNGVKDGIYPNLKRMAAQAPYFPEITRRIDALLDKTGQLRDNASPELADIRRSIRDRENSISRKAAEILRKAQAEGLADADAGVSIRDGKYLIPVNAAVKRRLPGFVMDQSASGKTAFVEPVEIIDLENEISSLHFEEARETARILHEFTEFLHPYLPRLLESAEFLGETDFIMAKARTALDFIAGMPIISQDGSLSLRKARHPLLERALHAEGKQMVPQDVSLTRAKHILLISGPNAGGKSVCLKTTGLLQYMFQWGMLIPTSEVSELPVFDRIMVSIGDNQSIDNDLSTYSSFLEDMKTMLQLADERTLVLIDEFGSGTEPAAGGAIAEAILSELDKRGVFGVITTHYTNLKLYASGSDTGVINGAMQFDAQKIAPLFKLETGLPGNSFAFEMARKMGLPESIVKDAEERAGEEFVGIERNLRRIVRNRRALDEKLQKIRKTDKALDAITEKYEKELSDLKARKQDILDEAKREAEGIVKSAGKAVEKTIRDIKEAQAEKEQTRAARSELQGFMAALEQKKSREAQARDRYIDAKLEKLRKRQQRKGIEAGLTAARDNAPLRIGEKVRLKSNGMVGEVTKVSGKSVSFVVGSLSSTVKADQLERISSGEFKAASKGAVSVRPAWEDPSIRGRKLNFRTELDVRGERLQDALDQVMHYVDDAIMLSMPSVRIIHGKGTGVLREEIQKYLRTVPGVASAQDEDIQLGGSGVTVVRFD